MRVVTGSELAYLPPQNVGDLGHFMVETKNGDVIEADLWFQCYGARANTGFLIGSDYESVMNPNGTIRVMAPCRSRITRTSTPSVTSPMCVNRSVPTPLASRPASHREHHAQIEGEKPDAIYQPTKEWVILPLGPNMGASQLLDADGQTRILGAEQTAEIKGTDLMVSVIRSQLNLP